ncbi:Transketolase 1 [Alphaproteobacteria bacterium SO-S41]|nr:Transketolase 1 [Alphaproteobacteria bacterium SO-S41]
MPAEPALSPELHSRMANALRVLSVDAVIAANSGHQGLPMGMADVATVLFSRFLKFDPRDPNWADRDRFILSAGHGSMLLYSLLHLTGYQSLPLDALRKFRQLNSPAAGHPEYGHCAGVETTTGPLGQGLATAVGFALAERLVNARFGDALVDHKTYVIASDGDLMEGISHEAISLAGHLKLNRLIVLFDDNGISIDGPLSLSESGDQIARFKAANWAVKAIDGHNTAEIAEALEWAQSQTQPVMIACKTVIGFGSPVAGTNKAHGFSINAEGAQKVRETLGWSYAPFELPDDVTAGWAETAKRGGPARAAWTKRLDASDQKAAFEDAMSGNVAAALAKPMAEARTALAAKPQNIATRKASEIALETVNATLANTVGGSADLTGSNNTLTKGMKFVTPGNYDGRFVHYGIREHGMAAAMNGMALHGGVIPYSGTFLVFADYARPAIRLAALMGIRVIHVLTHDSIGVGEDGPTHQPVEHIASLRAIPNLLVFRPCDVVEASEAWEIALGQTNRPSVMALTRQNLVQARTTDAGENLTAKGGYVLRAAEAPEKVALIATGSEIEIALKAREMLEAEGIGTRIVSLPSWELFEGQNAAYRAATIPENLVKVGIEAASPMGWDRYIGPKGAFIGMAGFGASAPYQDLYRHFGITPEAVVAAAKARL